EKLVLRGALEVPADRDATEIRINQHGSIAVVPSHAKEAGLAGAVIFQAIAQRCDISTGARGDCIEDIADRGKAGFDTGAERVDASLHHAANSWDEIRGGRNTDDASRSADNIHHVIGAETCAYGVPMSVKCSYWDGDSGFEP